MLRKKFAEYVMLDFHQKLIIAERENVAIPTNLELRRSPRIDILKYKKK